MSVLEADAVGLEIDTSKISDSRVFNLDFFDYNPRKKFDTIIGNPPYVRHRDILPSTLKKIDNPLDGRSNLYLHFIWRSIDLLSKGGELILITPREFLKATSAVPLNARLWADGSFTYFEDWGDHKIFPGFSPNCVVFRWEKGRESKVLDDGRIFREKNGQIWFGPENSNLVSDYFDVKVGAVSGADWVYSHPSGDTSFVCSRTRVSGETRRMIYNSAKDHPHLEKYKSVLISRKVKEFDDRNWWEWGRSYPHKNGLRIYVNGKTRQKDPFFVSEELAFDGSVLALFPRTHTIDLEQAAVELNSADWNVMGFVCGGRFQFSQRSLSNAFLELR